MASSRLLLLPEREVQEEPGQIAKLDFCHHKHSVLIVVGRSCEHGHAGHIRKDIERGMCTAFAAMHLHILNNQSSSLLEGTPPIMLHWPHCSVYVIIPTLLVTGCVIWWFFSPHTSITIHPVIPLGLVTVYSRDWFVLCKKRLLGKCAKKSHLCVSVNIRGVVVCRWNTQSQADGKGTSCHVGVIYHSVGTGRAGKGHMSHSHYSSYYFHLMWCTAKCFQMVYRLVVKAASHIFNYLAHRKEGKTYV